MAQPFWWAAVARAVSRSWRLLLLRLLLGEAVRLLSLVLAVVRRQNCDWRPAVLVVVVVVES